MKCVISRLPDTVTINYRHTNERVRDKTGSFDD